MSWKTSANCSTSPLNPALDELAHDLEKIAGIPVLNDQIATLKDDDLHLDSDMLELDINANDKRIEKIVDDLVAEHLPALEKKLKGRLLKAFSTQA